MASIEHAGVSAVQVETFDAVAAASPEVVDAAVAGSGNEENAKETTGCPSYLLVVIGSPVYSEQARLVQQRFAAGKNIERGCRWSAVYLV